jgi:hypothetical protein
MSEPLPPPKATAEPTERIVASLSDQESAGALIARIAIGLAGLGLLIGFFLPWIRLGELVSMSGLSMALTGGEAVKELSGFRMILLIVPLAGLALIASAIRSWAYAWVALASGILIFVAALFTLIRVFLDSTGAGMWVVAISALTAVAVGFIAYRRL